MRSPRMVSRRSWAETLPWPETLRLPEILTQPETMRSPELLPWPETLRLPEILTPPETMRSTMRRGLSLGAASGCSAPPTRLPPCEVGGGGCQEAQGGGLGNGSARWGGRGFGAVPNCTATRQDLPRIVVARPDSAVRESSRETWLRVLLPQKRGPSRGRVRCPCATEEGGRRCPRSGRRRVRGMRRAGLGGGDRGEGEDLLAREVRRAGSIRPHGPRSISRGP